VRFLSFKLVLPLLFEDFEEVVTIVFRVYHRLPLAIAIAIAMLLSARRSSE